MSKYLPDREPLSTLRLGTFDSERFWRDVDLSQLPGIPDKQAESIVSVMDELLFSTCDSQNDVLITRHPMDTAHRQYLAEIGFRFINNEKKVAASRDHAAHEATCGLLHEHGEELHFRQLLAKVNHYAPYSVLPTTSDFCRHYAIPVNCPNINTVAEVNSKLYSHRLAAETLGEMQGEIVASAHELREAGKRLLADGPLLVKDDFGVSGRGNLLIESSQLLKRIVRHLTKQENLGRQTRFLIEPLLEKALDFSCQLEISPDGAVKMVSVQQMDNAGFAFSAIRTADQAFIEHLEQVGYLERMENIAARLYQAGYFGPVCIDSMVLLNGDIRSVVEINARLSMGFINHYIDRFLQPFGKKGTLLFFSLGLSQRVRFEDLLQRMQQADILFEQHKPEGILPLSANTLTVNQPDKATDGAMYKGRLYVSIVADSLAQQTRIKQQLQHIFNEIGIKVYN